MQNIFIPKSNLPTQQFDTLDKEQTETLDSDSQLMEIQTNQRSNDMQQKITQNEAHSRPERVKKCLWYLKDYHCNSAAPTYTHCCNVISFFALSNMHKQKLLEIQDG